MLTDELFRKILLVPTLADGADTLMIVSGYATAGMVGRHLEKLHELNGKIALNLIVGMTKKDGIERAQHAAFNKIVATGAFESSMTCNYVVRGNPVHAKTYVWLRDNNPIAAFAGSANYTLIGFGRSQIESMDSIDPHAALGFHNQCLRNTASCDSIDIETMVAITESKTFSSSAMSTPEGDSITLSLLDTRTKDTHKKAGLNWGQRKGRNHNQAYIPVPRDVQLSGFFPDRGEQFTVLTDDGDSFIFARAQEKGKALHSTLDNSQIGEYIRARIGVRSGEYVTRQHLAEYGRTNVTFTKIDVDTYILDFRPNFGPGEDAEIG